MKSFAQSLILMLIFFLFVIIFLPKKELYFWGEQLLSRYHLRICEEKLSTSPFTLTISQGVIFFEDIKAATFHKATLTPALLYNTITLYNLQTTPALAPVARIAIKKLTITYTPFSPMQVKIDGTNASGALRGSIDIKQKKIQLDCFGACTQIRSLLHPTKLKEGHYRYETSF